MSTLEAHPPREHAHGFRRAWLAVKNGVSDLFNDDALMLAAAVSYFAALSLAPLAVLAIWVFSMLGQGSQDALVRQVESFAGSAGGDAFRMVLQNAEDRPGFGSWAGLVSAVTLLIGASAVFAQLQRALNTIFDVRPKKGGGAKASIFRLLRQRLLSMGMLLVIFFLLVVSLIASAAVGFITDLIPGPPWVWHLANTLVTIVLFGLLFAAMFKLLPDVILRWKDVVRGGIVTAILFAIGKLGLGIYLAHASVGSSYGAAGSLIVLLVWVYYSATILFLGAEFTQAWVLAGGHDLPPDSYAQRRSTPGVGT